MIDPLRRLPRSKTYIPILWHYTYGKAAIILLGHIIAVYHWLCLLEPTVDFCIACYFIGKCSIPLGAIKPEKVVLVEGEESGGAGQEELQICSRKYGVGLDKYSLELSTQAFPHAP